MTSSPQPAPADKGTKYHVLKERTDGGGVVYEPVEAGVTASSDKSAIKQAAHEDGTYIAIPARSFKPVKVTVETTKTIRLG